MQLHSDPFKEKAIRWADRFEYCCVLDSNGYADFNGKFDYLVAAGSQHFIDAGRGNAFSELKNFYDTYQTWMFGYLAYDLKNQLEDLKSANKDGLFFPDMFFFIPEYVVGVCANGIEVLLGSKTVLEEILNFDLISLSQPQAEISIHPVVCKGEYIKNVEAIKEHIRRGDIYELTYCQEFFAENACIDPLQIYIQLNALSPNPFAGYLKIKNKYILCASPERFLCKRGNTLLSQPIKGTAARGKTPSEDFDIKIRLSNDLKEQTENVMIVDLVRNDLTKSAVAGTVKVTELFGIHTFPQVHQLISTIECELAPDFHFVDAIKNTFPMGSMTGAPKIRAMELIDTYESSKRGAYSGAMGYISPDGAFDLNVIIRSIFYEAERRYLSFQVGGAITYASDSEKEYRECLLKASAILKTIKGPI
jgi:para-aminobenzoate synthetase component 1